MRRIERDLIAEYRESINTALALLNEENLAEVRRLAELPDAVRGYGGVKLAAIVRTRPSRRAYSASCGRARAPSRRKPGRTVELDVRQAVSREPSAQ